MIIRLISHLGSVTTHWIFKAEVQFSLAVRFVRFQVEPISAQKSK
jgi:hypothetical protein